jgi:hypothetical protein
MSCKAMWILVSLNVMEYGKLRRIYIIVLIGAISEILEYKVSWLFFFIYLIRFYV